MALGSLASRFWTDFSGGGGEVLFDGGSVGWSDFLQRNGGDADNVVLLAAIAYNQISEVYPCELTNLCCIPTFSQKLT